MVFTFAAALGLPAERIKRNPKDGLSYVWIPAGASVIGCSPDDRECFSWEPSSRPVRIEKGFWIGRTEVTQKAYRAVRGENPSRYQAPNRPVDQVGWIDAKEYCHAVGGRLPREIEWEYAARGRSSGPRYGSVDAIGWYDGNGSDQTHEVGLKSPNSFGLHDMLGNVWEWVEDRYELDSAKRILRGGSFLNTARDLRVSNRLWAAPNTKHRNMGIRCVVD